MMRFKTILIILAVVAIPILMASAERGQRVREQEQDGKNGVAMMAAFAATCQTLADQYDEVNHHLDEMMKIDDMEMLKREMRHHKELMAEMYEVVTEQKKHCDEMSDMHESRQER